MGVLRMGVNEVDQCGKIRCHAPILSGAFHKASSQSRLFFNAGLMTPTLCQLLPQNKRASAVGQCPLLETGSWLLLPVSSVAFAALHDALGVLTPICGERTAHVVL
jgi:hypothetical protein